MKSFSVVKFCSHLLCLCAYVFNSLLVPGPIKFFIIFIQNEESCTTLLRESKTITVAGFRLIFMRQIQSYNASGTGHITQERKGRDSGLCFTLSKKKKKKKRQN